MEDGGLLENQRVTVALVSSEARALRSSPSKSMLSYLAEPEWTRTFITLLKGLAVFKTGYHTDWQRLHCACVDPMSRFERDS